MQNPTLHKDKEIVEYAPIEKKVSIMMLWHSAVLQWLSGRRGLLRGAGWQPAAHVACPALPAGCSPACLLALLASLAFQSVLHEYFRFYHSSSQPPPPNSATAPTPDIKAPKWEPLPPPPHHTFHHFAHSCHTSGNVQEIHGFFPPPNTGAKVLPNHCCSTTGLFQVFVGCQGHPKVKKQPKKGPKIEKQHCLFLRHPVAVLVVGWIVQTSWEAAKSKELPVKLPLPLICFVMQPMKNVLFVI